MATKNKKKHLNRDEFSCIWESDRISMGKELSSWLWEGGYCYVQWITIANDCFLFFLKEEKEKCRPIYYSEYNDKTKAIRAQIYNKDFARNILRWFDLDNQSWYMTLCDLKTPEQLGKYLMIKPKENMARVQEQELIRKCSKCGRELPLSEFYAKGKNLQSYCNDCMKEHGRLRNGTTGEYREPDETLSRCTDKRLWEELKKRGYQIRGSKLVKVTYQTLE